VRHILMFVATSEYDALLLSLADVRDGVELVDERTHALQCASHARDAGASSELIVAALFHDVARSPLLHREFGRFPHEVAAAAWLKPRFGDYVAFLAGAHVLAKLYLIESEPAYRACLSAESLASAAVQGTGVASFPTTHPWWSDALRLRRWDDAAKDPAAPYIDETPFLDVVRSLQAAPPS
jgi:predicted HD phosphohydrolase